MNRDKPLSPISEKTLPDPVRISRKQSLQTHRFVETLRMKDQREKIRRFLGCPKVPAKADLEGKRPKTS